VMRTALFLVIFGAASLFPVFVGLAGPGLWDMRRRKPWLIAMYLATMSGIAVYTMFFYRG